MGEPSADPGTRSPGRPAGLVDPPGRSGGHRPGSTVRTRVRVVADGRERVRRDSLATEEPMEVRLLAGGTRRTLAVTMRTPGHDFELAAGFLHGEGLVTESGDISGISYCTDVDADQQYNIVNVSTTAPRLPDLPSLDRHFMTTSACGVCGKAGLDALKIRARPVAGPGPAVAAETLYGLPGALRGGQGLFESTGGLHAAGLFTADGSLLCVREDVGRHNAVDKLVGWALLGGHLPLDAHILMVSGRTSYEIMQKALVAGIPVVAAVSAPSSLAVALAGEFGMTLVGFLRDRRFNIYAGERRVRAPAPAGEA
jgi:FdhD protein